MRNIFKKKKERTIEVRIPNGFMNCGVSFENKFYADTNNSAAWDYISFPLPKPKYRWQIKGYIGTDLPNDGKCVVLIDKK